MPRYDYACSACGEVVEFRHGINEAGPRTCPNCGREGTMRKTFAAPTVHFKGSGWAKKDRSTTSSPTKSRSSSSSEPTAGADSGSTASSASGGGSAGGTASASTKSSEPAKAKATEGD